MSVRKKNKQALMEALDQHFADPSLAQPGDDRAELAGLIHTAAQLQDQAEFYQPDPDYLTRNRARLLARIQASRPVRGRQFAWWTAWKRQSPLLRVVSAVVVLMVVFFSGSSLTLAAHDALPGSGLYPLRKLVENLRLGLSIDPTRDAELHLDFAQSYLVDCALLASQGRYPQARQALQNYDQHIVAAGRILGPEVAFGNWQNGALQSDLYLTLTQDAAIVDLLPTY